MAKISVMNVWNLIHETLFKISEKPSIVVEDGDDTYLGFSRTRNPELDQRVWQIRKVEVVGSTTKIFLAQKGEDNLIFDDGTSNYKNYTFNILINN